MKVISVWSPKGGVGKTTLACHLAAGLLKHKQRVVGVDLDPQESWVWMHKQGRLPFPVLSAYPATQPDADFMVVDHPPRAEFPPHGGLVVVPLRAGALDYQAWEQAKGAVAGKKTLLVFNAVDGRRSEEQQVVASFPGVLTISNLAAIPKVTGWGATIFHNGVERLPSINHARAQFDALLAEVLKLA